MGWKPRGRQGAQEGSGRGPWTGAELFMSNVPGKYSRRRRRDEICDGVLVGAVMTQCEAQKASLMAEREARQ